MPIPQKRIDSYDVDASVSDDTALLASKNGKTINIKCSSLPKYVQNNITYNDATESTNGLMSANDKFKLNYTNIAYATCSTAAATAAKVATITGNEKWELKIGSIVIIKYSITNTASNCTLNVNNTGAKPFWYNASVYTGNSSLVCGIANHFIIYMYDGTNWVWIGHSADNNSTYSNVSLGQGYGTCSTAAATVAKVVTLSNYELVVGGVIAVKFTYAVPASTTMNINSKGAKAIYHSGAAIKAGVINAGDTCTFMYNGSQYVLLSIDRQSSSSSSSGHGVEIKATEPTGQNINDEWLQEY